jgi:hypothetical protein
MVLDLNGTARDAHVERLQALMAAGEIPIRQPRVAYQQMQHPQTPSAVREAMRPQIFTMFTPLTSTERECNAQVRAIMRGNSDTDQHDADAAIIFEAQKYGGYLITEDARILKRRLELQAVPAPAPVWIVALEEFLAIYDKFAEETRELDELMASLE